MGAAAAIMVFLFHLLRGLCSFSLPHIRVALTRELAHGRIVEARGYDEEEGEGQLAQGESKYTQPPAWSSLEETACSRACGSQTLCYSIAWPAVAEDLNAQLLA